jgi:hypothetical protein
MTISKGAVTKLKVDFASTEIWKIKWGHRSDAITKMELVAPNPKIQRAVELLNIG